MIVTNLVNSFNPVPKSIKEKVHIKTNIRQKSNKLMQLERNRFSIITNNLNKCYFCDNEKMELHEVFRGRNRQKSMKWGLVIPVCQRYHKKITEDKKFSEISEQIARNLFIKRYGKEKFIEEFK